MKRIFLFSILGILLTACTAGQLKQASNAIASNVCQSLKNGSTEFNWGAYHFKSKDDLDVYLDSIRNTEDFNTLVIQTRQNVEKSCPKTLKAANLKSADVVDSLLQN